MILMPDLTRVCADPFAAQATVKIFCDIYDPETNAPYERDPRSIAKAAEAAKAEAERELADRTGEMEVAEAQAKLMEAVAQLQAMERLRKNLRR